MFILVIDTEDTNSLAIQSALQGVFGTPMPADPYPLGLATQGSPYGTSAGDGPSARSVTGDGVSEPVAGAVAGAWAEQAHWLGESVEPMAGIDPTDHMISPPTSLGYTADGVPLVPLDIGNGQVVYVPSNAVPGLSQFEPVQQAPSAPAEPNMPPYLVAQPYITDPTDSLIPQSGFDQFQQFAPRAPQYNIPIPMEPSADELQMWAAQERAAATARFQQQQLLEMQQRGINGQVPPSPDFTGFPDVPQVQYQPNLPTSNI